MHVLLDSLEDALKTPRKQGMAKEARYRKIGKESPGDIHTVLLTRGACKEARDFKIHTEFP